MLQKKIRIKHFDHILLFSNSMYLLLIQDLTDCLTTGFRQFSCNSPISFFLTPSLFNIYSRNLFWKLVFKPITSGNCQVPPHVLKFNRDDSKRFQLSWKNLLDFSHLPREVLSTAGGFRGRGAVKLLLGSKAKAFWNLSNTTLWLALNSLCKQGRQAFSIIKTLA